MVPKYKFNDFVEVSVRKIVPRGLGLAFLPGLTVFVPLSAAGDRLLVRLREIRGKTAIAEIERIIEPSPDRVVPPCRYYGVCGGCDLQHIEYQAQLKAKVGIVEDCLTRIGKLDSLPDILNIPSEHSFAYRSRTQWQYDGQSNAIGYYRRGTHEVISIEECPILIPELQDRLLRLSDEIGPKDRSSAVLRIEAAAGDDGEISVNAPEFGIDPIDISDSSSGESISFSARVFFQGNRSLLKQLVETAVGDEEGSFAVDLYCGAGLFTLALARRFDSVKGVEENKEAVRYARMNAEAAGLPNVEFYAESVGYYLESTYIMRPDLVLLDPPRSGTEKALINSIVSLEPARVVYVSCDPAMLARDLRQFAEGGYHADSITAIDLFPQTHHVETVARLIRKE